jgi:septal ring factor EnvC (AmiA/AmiB activator)
MTAGRGAGVGLLALAGLAAVAAAATDSRSGDAGALDARRRALRAEVEQVERELARSESSRADAAEALKATAIAISDANRRLHELAQTRRDVEASLASLEEERANREREVVAEQAMLARLLAHQHAGGAFEPLKLLLSGRNPAEIGRLLSYYRAISEARARMITDLRARQQQANALATEAKARRQELATVADDELAQRATLERERAQQAAVVARHGADIRRQQRELERLKRNDLRLARLVDRLVAMARPRPAPPAKPSATGRPPDARGSRPAAGGQPPAPDARALAAQPRAPGAWAMPVRGELASRFGAPRDGGGTLWKGWFIRCAAGAEVKAVAAGQVVYADWLRGFGNLLIVDHGDGYMSLYGNNDALLAGVGAAVRAGDAVAQAGPSGGTGGPGVYFEIRHQGRPVDPAVWIGR